jgi:site-specific recombinase XerD
MQMIAGNLSYPQYPKLCFQTLTKDQMKIDEFMLELGSRTNSKETMRAYRQDLERFERFLKSEGIRINQVKRSTMVKYLAYLEALRGRTTSERLSPATKNRRLTIVSEYFDWLQRDSDKTISNPVALLRRPTVQNENPSPVDDVDLSKLVTGLQNLRDKALILIFVYSGLRLFELYKLNINSISIRVRQVDGQKEYYGHGRILGKGSKERNFIIGPKAVEALKAYLLARQSQDANAPLFLSSRKTRLSCRSMQHLLAEACRRLGLNRIHVHQLRHTFATRNVNAGMSMEVLKELLGHEQLTATQRYFKVDAKRIQREYYAAMEYVSQSSDL